jgi:hypothetical protein
MEKSPGHIRGFFFFLTAGLHPEVRTQVFSYEDFAHI